MTLCQHLTARTDDLYPIVYYLIFYLLREHIYTEQKICNNTVIKDSTIPQVCRYTTL